MFNSQFYPTPQNVIEIMLEGQNITNKVILEPSAGKGDIVDFLTENGAKEVLTCENNEDLKKILQTKSRVIESDFLQITSDKISHIDFIIMNPPFDADEKHILHACNIAPAGCQIIALCNFETLNNPFSTNRKELLNIINNLGGFENLGDCFSDAERKTGVNVGLIKIKKAGESVKNEFEGFFMDEEPEEKGESGIMSYNAVRDLVNRYINAVKIYGELQTVEKRLNNMTGTFFGGNIGLSTNLTYNSYKRELQKAGWKFIFNKMNLTKNTTKGLMDDINKFVEQQTQIPFTMKNIYHMLDLVYQTTGQRMDKAILEAFDRVTSHHHENRYNVKGWKTNSHFLIGKKFILPNIIRPEKEYGYKSEYYSYLKNSYDGTIPDFEKALCFVTATNWDNIKTVNCSISRNSYGEWYESHFFRYKAYKNGNMHFEFISDEVWGLFNQRVAKLKGFPLFEGKEQTAYQKRQTGRDNDINPKTTTEPTILASFKFKTA